MRTRALVYTGTSVIVLGIFLCLLFALINPMTLKRDTSSCLPFPNYGGAMCGMLYGGILPMFFSDNILVFEILSLLVVAFGATLIAIGKVKLRQSSIER